MGGVRRNDGLWGSKVLECDPTPVKAVLVDPKPGGQTTSSESREPLDTSGPESWSLEHPTKDLCPAMDVNRLI
ncbi:jg18013 [Pararge aegeria aegeria]|uniref:Jg18013 protein n=1 Tax=Pararge aegeria aegeria TaxID=348720 RepID=A0A8S4RLV6_9NEOP|nr:jg18013 [Pararge aegeria aegeria]